MSIQPHVEVWDSCPLTNLLGLIHELPSLGFPLGIRIENVLERDGKEKEVHRIGMRTGLAEADPLVNQPRHETNGSASKNGRLAMAD
jgi:hypothetical protein